MSVPPKSRIAYDAAGTALRISVDGWISTPGIPVDFGGPIDAPFDPIPHTNIDQPIIAILSDIVRRHPSAIAVQSEGGPMHYDAMWRHILRLASAIDEHAPVAGVIGIVIPSSREWRVAVFACTAAQRVAVPLDPQLPLGRLNEMIAVAGIGLILVADDVPVIPLACPTLSVVEFMDDYLPVPPPPLRFLDMDEPAFVIFTSGSSGRPKAIVRSQRSQLHVAFNNINAMHLAPTDRILSVMSPASFGGFNNLLRVSLCGASLQAFNMARDGFKALLITMEQEPVTVLQAGTSLLRMIATLPRAPVAMARLRIVMTGGEPLMKIDHDVLRRYLPDNCLIRSNYGATEGGSIGWFVNGPDDHHLTRVANGYLAPDTEAMIIDEVGQPCAAGVAGELAFRSRYMSMGELVDGKLTPGRVGRDPGDIALGIYSTGDMARYSDDGVFVVLGRKDRQLKVNGQRVEPAEIEVALRSNVDVAHAVVIGRQDGLAALLYGFVIPSSAAGSDLEKRLLTLLRARLPGYMVPSRIVLVNEFPLLPGGKLDEEALLRRK